MIAKKMLVLHIYCCIFNSNQIIMVSVTMSYLSKLCVYKKICIFTDLILMSLF